LIITDDWWWCIVNNHGYIDELFMFRIDNDWCSMAFINDLQLQYFWYDWSWFENIDADNWQQFMLDEYWLQLMSDDY
jgi:hypothetical protein